MQMTDLPYDLPDARGHFGPYGGVFVAETLIRALDELREQYARYRNDPAFVAEFEDELAHYVGRPSPVYHAKRWSEKAGGAQIWLKREDLNHTGAHKINNCIGQALLAKRLGKPRVIAETGAGQHGVATATVAARFGMECVVYMGAEDIERQAQNVFRMKLLGATVVPVESGSKTLKDALNEAMRDWVTNVENTFYIIGTCAGPHPYPMMVRDFQSVIGRECLTQMPEAAGRDPDAVIACVGGGSNAIGIFHPYIPRAGVRLIGVEAAGDGIDTGRHAASLTAGRPGVLHGNRTYLLQDADGQIVPTHSISAGLDYPGVGPEHAWLKDTGRAEYVTITDAEALAAFHDCCRHRRHHSGARIGARARLRRAARGHAAEGQDPARQPLRPRRQGHAHRRRALGARASSSVPRATSAHESHRRRVREAARRGPHRAHPVRHRRRSDRSRATLPILSALVDGRRRRDRAGRSVLRSDGRRSGHPARLRARARAGRRARAACSTSSRAFRKSDATTPIVLMGYANPIEAMGTVRVRGSRARGRRRRRARRRLSARRSRRVRRSCSRSAASRSIFLLAPTTPEARIAAVAKLARGFVYYVSLKGVTGAGHLDTGDVRDKLAEIRRHVKLPVGVGFGIRDAASAQAIAADADAVVIGSRLIQEIEAGPAGRRGRSRGRVARRHSQGARLDAKARGMTGRRRPFVLARRHSTGNG